MKMRKKLFSLFGTDGKLPICDFAPQLPMMIVYLLVLLPLLTAISPPNVFILSTNSQLVLDHPRNRVRADLNNISTYDPVTISPPQFFPHKSLDPMANHEIKRIRSSDTASKDPLRNDDHHALLRRLSSTMLLESLLRHPFPINKSTFPPLVLPSISRPQQHKDGTTNENSIRQKHNRQVSSLRASSPVFKMDTSTSNHSSVTDHVNSLNQRVNFDTFNSSSLNYLVEKLLSLKGSQDEQTPQQRPKMRQKLFNDSSKTTQSPSDAATAMDLDSLIKHEYDSRVEPMFKSLRAQQNLSFTSAKNTATTKSWPLNHKLDQAAAENDPTTTSSSMNDPNFQDTTPNLFANIPTTSPTSQDSQIESSTTQEPETNMSRAIFDGLDLSDFDDSDEDEEEEEINGMKDDAIDQSPSHEPIRSNPVKKTLQNVPPYLLSESFSNVPKRSNLTAIDVSLSETRATTSSTKESNDLNVPKGKNATREGTLQSDKAAGASMRGSMVFSDGAEEAEKASRQRNQQRIGPEYDNRGSSTPRPKSRNTPTPSRSTNTKSDKLGESSLLNQLFSTVNPLTELTIKLNENSNSRNNPELTFQNPLIYKGYVGKDDYLLSTTASDWSRPLGMRDHRERDDNGHKFRTYSRGPSTYTTPAPPTDPPSVPYNYFLHQPVTNAQSVPTIVIPTSDPLDEITTRPPRERIELIDGKRITTYQRSSGVPTHISHINDLSHSRSINSSPIDRATLDNQDRRYSYQMPDSTHNRYHSHRHEATTSQNDFHNNSGTIQPYTSTVSDSKSKTFDSSPNQMPGVSTSQNWSPTKMQQDENSYQNRTSLSVPAEQLQNFSGVLFVTGNSSSPALVPLVKLTKNTGENTNGKYPSPDLKDIIHGLDIALNAPTANGSQFRANSFQNHTTGIGNQRVKIKSTTDKVRSNSHVVSDADMESYENLGEKKVNPKNGTSHWNNSTNIFNIDKTEESQLDNPEIDAPDSTQWPSYKRDREKAGIGVVDVMGENQNRNSAKKVKPLINHEPAGSEISLTELNKGNRVATEKSVPRWNQTSAQRPPTSRSKSSPGTESIMFSGTDGGSIHLSSNADPSQGAGSLGSTIIPSNNFYGDVSSERPVMVDDTTSTRGPSSRIPHQTSNAATEDPYERISSNTILTKIQQPLLTTPIPSTPTKNLQPKDESAGSKSGKSSNDRLAFILIGGSCVLSVVCLVLAAMSMRCSDMCDDYRSLRNAERAALKLQRHRLKYTKNHQVNRVSHEQRRSEGMIDDLNHGGVRDPVDAAGNHVGDLKFNKSSMQYGNQQVPITNNNLDLSNLCLNAANHQVPTLIHKSGGIQPCNCANCLNQQRWFCRDEAIATNGKHLSWLHPYYYMQQHGRLRPLFGVGSSVGTFFPRRMGDQTIRGGSSVDAQILIDNQSPHVCLATENPRVTRSKSILDRKLNLHQQHHHHHTHASEGTFDVHSHLRCNNPGHNHTQHVCQNHHKCNLATSASEESETTVDEGVHCDNSKCLINHLNQNLSNKFRMIQNKNNGYSHSNKTEAWKLGSARRATHNHKHSHNCHNHQPPSSDTSSVIQCTCSKDQQPLIGSRVMSSRKVGIHKHSSRHGVRSSSKQAKRDKSMLVWSTNGDRLI